MKEIGFFLLAGAFTSIHTLTHAMNDIFSWSASHPEDAQRYAEDAVFLQKAIHESMRLHPSSPTAGRRPTCPMHLPSGQVLGPQLEADGDAALLPVVVLPPRRVVGPRVRLAPTIYAMEKVSRKERIDKSKRLSAGLKAVRLDRASASRWGRYIDQVRREAGRPTRPKGLGPTPTAIISRSAVREIAESLRPPGAPPAIAPVAKPPPLTIQAPVPRAAPPPLPSSSASPKPGSPARPMPSRRKFPRYDAELELDVRDLGELHRMLTRDVSHGGMFIVTDAPLEAGTRLLLQVIHPVSDERFDISAVVRRREAKPQGIGVEFVDLTEARREAFMSFIRASLQLEDVLLVDENDPDLA
jgi:Tfp pilus assembly protein PilZ